MTQPWLLVCDDQCGTQCYQRSLSDVRETSFGSGQTARFGWNRMERRVTCEHHMELTCGKTMDDTAARMTVGDSSNLRATHAPRKCHDFGTVAIEGGTSERDVLGAMVGT
jgi:hypothetical protein